MTCGENTPCSRYGHRKVTVKRAGLPRFLPSLECRFLSLEISKRKSGVTYWTVVVGIKFPLGGEVTVRSLSTCLHENSQRPQLCHQEVTVLIGPLFSSALRFRLHVSPPNGEVTNRLISGEKTERFIVCHRAVTVRWTGRAAQWPVGGRFLLGFERETFYS